jgi:hypothetical protein
MIVLVASWSEDEEDCSEEGQDETEVSSETSRGDKENIPLKQKATNLKWY